MGLRDRLHHKPAELSGGQQQRVAVARTLAARPAIVFADEPTGNLDSRSGNEILEFLRKAVSRYHQTIVMVTHDPNAASCADRVVFLSDGRSSTSSTIRRRNGSSIACSAWAAEMFRATVKSLLGHKLRVALTALSIVLGVAFVAGTYVFTDTIKSTFNEVFATANVGVDVNVRSASNFDVNTPRKPVPDSLLPTVKSVTGVQDAQGSVFGFAQVIDKDGKAVHNGQAPTFGFNWGDERHPVAAEAA